MAPVGPEVLAQEIPDTPAICQLAVPLGVTPPVGPVTVALKVKVPPRLADGLLVVTETEGLNFETEITDERVGPAVL